MKLVIAKPAMAAFEGDLKDSLSALEVIKSEFGFSNNGLKVNRTLNLETGLQLILRQKDIPNLDQVAETIRKAGADGVPLSIHAPYNYGASPEDWATADLSQGTAGREALAKVVAFGDRINAHSIAVHPNAIRGSEALLSPEYTRERRIAYLNSVFESIFEANSKARAVRVDLENKPFPATTADNEGIMYSIAFAPIQDILEFTSRGGTITFDTCHYGITMRTINYARDRLEGELTDKKIRERGLLGYFASEFSEQPDIAAAMNSQGIRGAIRHIHLNDGSIYRPVDKTGRPDKERMLPSVGKVQLWWEAYVPGAGELCGNEVILPWLENSQGENRRVDLTVEVTEFDRDYKNNPRFKEAASSMVNEIFRQVSDAGYVGN